jgi:hypothetical protein
MALAGLIVGNGGVSCRIGEWPLTGLGPVTARRHRCELDISHLFRAEKVTDVEFTDDTPRG